MIKKIKDFRKVEIPGKSTSVQHIQYLFFSGFPSSADTLRIYHRRLTSTHKETKHLLHTKSWVLKEACGGLTSLHFQPSGKGGKKKREATHHGDP